jgi:hypothetical protein
MNIPSPSQIAQINHAIRLELENQFGKTAFAVILGGEYIPVSDTVVFKFKLHSSGRSFIEMLENLDWVVNALHEQRVGAFLISGLVFDFWSQVFVVSIAGAWEQFAAQIKKADSTMNATATAEQSSHSPGQP